MSTDFRSALYAGFLTHARKAQPAHSFRYPVYLHLLDLEEVPHLDRSLWLFGAERARPVSFRRRDHLGDPEQPLLDSLRELFRERGEEFPGGRVLLLTHCAVFGYAFNPVSVYWCHDDSGRLRATVADVRNTFGERYPYLLRADEETPRRKKLMHVSPFFSLQGTYAFDLPVPGERATLGIDLHHADRPVLVARLHLERRPLSDAALARMLLAYPLMPLRVIASIHVQAARLWARGARVYAKPPYDPSSAALEPL